MLYNGLTQGEPLEIAKKNEVTQNKPSWAGDQTLLSTIPLRDINMTKDIKKSDELILLYLCQISSQTRAPL